MFLANSSCGPSPLDFALEATPRALVLPVSLLAGYVLESFVFKMLSVNTKGKTLAGVFKFLRFEERFRKAPYSRRIIGLTQGRTGVIKLRYQISQV